jgi:hypothetical protein
LKIILTLFKILQELNKFLGMTDNKEPRFSTLIYSKYSSNSTKFLELIKNSGVDFTNLLKLELLCIDNQTIRNRIMKNTKIDIKSVPCVLIVFPDGNIEKYDGDSVFNWASTIISNHKQVVEQNRQQKENYEKTIKEQAIEEVKLQLRKEQEMKKKQEQISIKPIRRSLKKDKKQKTRIHFDDDDEDTSGNSTITSILEVDEDPIENELEKNKRHYEELQRNKDYKDYSSLNNGTNLNFTSLSDLPKENNTKKLNKAEMMKHSLLEKAKEMERERKP